MLDEENKNELNKLQLSILLCVGDDNLEKLFSDYIKELFSGKYDVKLISTYYANHLLQLAEKGAFDIFILVLNNIHFPSGNLPAEKRIEQALQLVRYLKANYTRPVIALYGWPRDPSFPEKAKQAGASFVFEMPFKLKPFGEAIEKCLEAVPAMAEAGDFQQLALRAEQLNNQGEYHAVVKLLEPYAKSPNNKNTSFFNELGIAYGKIGSQLQDVAFWHKAYDCHKTAYGLDSNEPIYMFNLAMAATWLGHYDEGKELLTKYLESGHKRERELAIYTLKKLDAIQ